jgi:hypothetical protein
MVTWIPEGPEAGLMPLTTGADGGGGGGVVLPGAGVGAGAGLGTGALEGPTATMVGVVVFVCPLAFLVVVGGVTSTPWVPTFFPADLPVASGK